MIYMNSKMIDSFNEVYSHKSLSTELSCILDSGFVEINKCVFFSFLWSDEYSDDITIDNIKEQFLDFSGCEFSINKIYIEDYVSKNTKDESFCFVNAFKVKWNKVFPGKPCVLFLYFKSNEYGFSSVFSFHVKRIDECVLDISSIEDFEDEIYVEILN